MGVQSQINGVAWSLEIEIQFYLLMPLLALIFLVKHQWIRRAILLTLAASAMAVQPVITHNLWQGWQYDNGKWAQGRLDFDRHLLNYIQYFVVGLLLADIYVTEWRGAPPQLKRTGIGWGDFAWLVGWPAVVVLLLHGGLSERVLFAPIILLLYIALFYSVWARALMRIPLLTIIGGMCYSIYLMHNAIIQFFAPYIYRFVPQNALAGVVLGLILVPVILVLCGLYFRLIERPCMRPDWPRRVWQWFSSRLFVEEQEPSQTR
jgi:peptidoglycan/LPS O-acetylase OafA/YrhL